MRCNATLALLSLIAVAVTVPGCSRATALPAMDRPPAVTASAAEVALAQSSNSEFATALYRQLADERPGENLFFSPFSISSALLIATEGASGETADQMGKVLQVPQSLRNTGPDAATLPWLLTDLHKGQAAIYYRLSPEPLAPEVSDKVEQWRKELAAANNKTAALEQTGKWDEAQQSQAAAQKIADSLNQLFSTTEPYEWHAANALWLEKAYSFRASYLDTIHKFYGDVAVPVDFRAAAEAARGQINQWVALQTHDRINDLLGSGTVDSNTQLVITNAVYFKGEWLKPFEASATRSVDFHLADGKSVSTSMMTEYLDTGYGAFNADGTLFKTPHEIPVEMPDSDPSLYPDARGFTAIRLPYKAGKMFMAIFVPQTATGLAELEQKLLTGGPKPWIDQLANRTVNLNVPKFKLEAEYPLAASLQAMGMKRAFTRPQSGHVDGAEFDRMTASNDPDLRLFISAVIHKTFIEVNEKGTEAAAATAVAMDKTAAVPFERPKTRPFIPIFWADKPFLFAICDSETHSILFLGRLVRP